MTSPPPERAARAALALWLSLATLVALQALLPFVAGMWGWGLNLLAFAPPRTGWALWAVAALALAPLHARLIAGAIERVGSALGGRMWILGLVCALGAALLAWRLPDVVHYTGDFLLRQGAIEQSVPATELFPQALPLDVALHYHLPRWLIQHGARGAADAARLIGAVEAAALAWLAVAFGRTLGLRGVAAVAGAALVFFGGWLGLMTGYGKAFSEEVVLALAIAGFGVRAAERGEALLPLGACLALALALHRSGLAFLPAGALALALGMRVRGAQAGRRPDALLALALPVAALALVGPRIFGTLAGFDLTHHLSSPAVRGAGGVLGAAFAPDHLLDLVNLAALLSPLALAIPLLLLAGGRSLAGGRAGAVMIALAVPQLVMMLFVHPTRGVFQDWDVFAPAGITLATLAALLVGRTLEAAASWRWLGASVALDAAAYALLWLVHSNDLDRGLTRVAAAALGPPPRSEAERGISWEFLGTRYHEFGHPRESAEAMARVAALTPSARILMEWGLAEARRGDYETARRAFEGAVERDPTQARLWMNLLQADIRLGDLAAAERAALQIRRLIPGNALAERTLAEIQRRRAQRGRK